MATIQVILAGQLRTTIHDTFDYPLVLQFNDKFTYDEAEWVIPSYPRHIPAYRLSEIRVQDGPISVLVDGPEGFRHGPYLFDWIRSYYPRGKSCAFVLTDKQSFTKMQGVSIRTFEGSLVVEELLVGHEAAPAEPAPEQTTPPSGDVPPGPDPSTLPDA